MKKALTLSLITICLAGAMPKAFCQNTKKQRQNKEVAVEDADNEDDTVQVASGKHRGYAKGKEAPIMFGVHGGLNDATLIFGGTASGAKYGILLGGIMDVHVGGIVHLETGLLYAMTGGSNIVYVNTYNGQAVSGDYTWGVNTIELPATFEFKFGKPGRNHFFLGLGAYVALNVNGSISPNDVNGGTLKIGSSQTDDLKALDIGIGFDIGYQFKTGLFLRVRGQGGLNDLRAQSEGLYVGTIRTSSSVFEVGYLFGKVAKHPGVRHAPAAWE